MRDPLTTDEVKSAWIEAVSDEYGYEDAKDLWDEWLNYVQDQAYHEGIGDAYAEM